ncbi:MAG TPA: phospholipase D-like domain-containing protein, partial [Burkholderiales bacterium]|nr:phospholipase D-like domain-containing protein [Burkholderiales bacterium]
MSKLDVEREYRPARAAEPDVARDLADRAFARAAGASLIVGNRVRILRDARENFPAWLDAIHDAKRTIFFESYIIGADHVGREFVAALADRARAGVRVRLICDWFGTGGSAALFAPLVTAEGEVCVFNPPRFDSPFGWLTRDHRKMIAVDGQVGFVTGLGVSARWLGNP